MRRVCAVVGHRRMGIDAARRVQISGLHHLAAQHVCCGYTPLVVKSVMCHSLRYSSTTTTTSSSSSATTTNTADGEEVVKHTSSTASSSLNGAEIGSSAAKETEEGSKSDSPPTKDDASATTTTTASAKEDEEDGEGGEEVEKDDDDDDDDHTEQIILTEEQQAQRHKQLLREASVRMIFERRMTPDRIDEHIFITHVQTPSGVRWTDIRARPSLFKANFLDRIPEGEFAAAVLRTYGKHLPDEMAPILSSTTTLPMLHVAENSMCLLLRTASTRLQTHADVASSSSSSSSYTNIHDPTSGASSPKTSWGDRLRERLPCIFARGGPRRASSAKSAAISEANHENNNNSAMTSATTRRPRGRRQRLRVAPTLVELTERLHIFMVKEEEEPSPTSDGTTPTTTPTQNADSSCTTKDGSKTTTTQPTRWRVLTIHRSEVPFITDLLRNWQEFTRGGRRRRQSFAGDHFMGAFWSAANTRQVVAEMEDLVRQLFYSSVHTLHSTSVLDAQKLDDLENSIFASQQRTSSSSSSSARGGRSIAGVAQTMTDLHALSREASIRCSLLREMRLAYTQYKKEVQSPLSVADQRDLAALDKAVRVGTSIEEQASSLLFLQVSVAMNETETHLRTLTIFTTFFIPLDFIVSCCGMNFEFFTENAHNNSFGYGLLAIMLLTSGVTWQWIKRNLRST